ncbi:MAG: hypothetical protein M1480_16775 [Bacteroidetes bacterium]|nr:hypothetical protein [Bacteroidota bacterium]
MLNKIDNVSAGSEYGKTGRPSGYIGNFASAYTHHVDYHDSVNISPALQFLNQVQWRLKEFKHVANEKLYLSFIASEVEFQTSVDLINIDQLKYLNYHTIKEFKLSNESKTILSDFSAKISEVRYDNEPVLINFSALNVFFQRVLELRINRELTRSDKFIFDELVDGLTTGLKTEFIQLNNQIFIFINKLVGIKINSKEKAESDFNESLIIKNLKISDAK